MFEARVIRNYAVGHECFRPHGAINTTDKREPGLKMVKLLATSEESGLACQLHKMFIRS
jgi:hypothetical protein